MKWFTIIVILIFFFIPKGFSQQQVNLVLPLGHTEGISSIGYCLDSDYIVTAGNNNSAKLWEIESGKLLYDLGGHDGEINSIQISSDGEFIVTASDDGTAKIWQAKTGKLMYDLQGHTRSVNSIHMSPDGRFLVTTSDDYYAKLWDASNGMLLFTLPGHRQGVDFAKFSPDGNYLVTESGINGNTWVNDSIIPGKYMIWEVVSGKLLFESSKYKNEVSSFDFSPNSRFIAIVNGDKSAKIWNISANKTLNVLDGHTDVVVSAQFSQDGKNIITASKDSTAIVWDVLSGDFCYKLDTHTSGLKTARFSPDGMRILTAFDDNTLKIWEAATGHLVYDIKAENKDLSVFQFSPNGQYIAAIFNEEVIYDKKNNINYVRYESNLKMLDVTSGSLVLDDFKHNERNIMQFSPDGKYLAAVAGNVTSVWNTTNGNLMNGLDGQVKYLHSGQISPDGKLLLTAFDKKVLVWDVSNGKFLFELGGQKNDINEALFSPDGKFILTISNDSVLQIWDTNRGKQKYSLTGHSEGISSLQFSHDGEFVMTTSHDNKSNVWDIQNGSLFQSISDSLIKSTNEGSSFMEYSIKLSPDGKYVLPIKVNHDSVASVYSIESMTSEFQLIGHNQPINEAFYSQNQKYIVTINSSIPPLAKVWKAENGEFLYDFTIQTLGFWTVGFSPNGNKIITTTYEGDIQVWNASDGKLIYSLEGHDGWYTTAQFSPNGKSIVSVSSDGTIKVWDLLSGQLVYDLDGHDGHVRAQFSRTGDYLLTVGAGGKAIIWDFLSGEMLYTRLHLKGGDWLVYDQHYRYDGSEGARDYLYFTCGLEVIELDQMKDALYVPGLVEKIMNDRDINYPKLSDLDICGALPLVEPLEENEKNYEYKITPRKYGLEGVEVYVNDKKVLYYSISDLKRKEGAYNLRIKQETLSQHFIPGQENTVNVQAIATGKGREIRSRGMATLQYYEEPEMAEDPKLYAVMVGVNDYKDDELDLNYPAKDATNLSDALKLSAGKLLGDENVFIYEIHSETTAKEGFTTPEKEGIRKALEDIGEKANPQDVVLIFFAGHGVMQGEEEKVFTFLTAEASEFNPVGITTSELQNWLSYEGPHKMRANKSIMIFDACHSGKASEELIAMARDDDETQRIRQVEDLKDKSGMFILAASAPNQSAYELPQYEQGLLTYSLLYTMKNNPEILDEGKYLNVQKWFLESEEYLQNLVRKMGYQQDAQPYGTANIRIGEVNEEVKNSITLAKEKPVLFCANVLNGSTFTDDLQLKSKVNSQLDEVTRRGNESGFIYSRVESPNANLINIIYQTDGDKVTCQLKLIKGEQQLHQKTISGSKAELDKLVNDIIKEVAAFAK